MWIDSVVARLAVAALSGLAVGLEREWSGHASGPLARFAGLRTFFLLGTLGGVAGWLAASSASSLAAVLVAGGAALVVAAYWVASRPGGQTVEGTTEVAALVVISLGVLAGLGFLELTSGATAVIVLVLSEKERLRGAVARIGREELRAALQFAVLALVVLPLLPNQTYGPLGGFQPRALWMVVLVFSALNFAGYLARKSVGVERGYGMTGLFGGIVSSTAVTFQFSRLSRQDPRLATGLAVGVVGACTVLLPRVFLVSAVLNFDVALQLLPFFLPPFAAGAAAVSLALLRHWEPGDGPADEMIRNPLRLGSAIRMALAFQVSLMAIAYVRDTLGASGILASAALLGLTDMDALTVSMNRVGESPDLVGLAARAIGVGVVANSVLKLTLAMVLGAPRYRALAGAGLGALTAVTVGALWVFW
jgi:uncharacterized membrane protein (DUF4010 family)